MAGRKVAILGKGNVGGALRQGLERAGHEVRATGKDPKAVREAAEWGDIVVLAVPYGERRNAVQEAGKAALANKTLVDVTNALGEGMAFAAPPGKSGAEEVAAWVGPDCCVVKAFNTVFAHHMATGSLDGEPLTVLCAGDDPEAKQEVQRLGRDLGFDAVDAGPLAHARHLESIGYLNVQMAYVLGQGPQTGFLYRHPGAPRERPARTGSRTEPRPEAATDKTRT